MGIESAILIRSREHLEELMSEKEPLMIYFSSHNCNVCQAVFPKLMDLVEAHPIKVAKVNIDECVEIAGQLLVFTVPTVLIINDSREILRESRFIDFWKVERILSLLADSTN